MPNTTKKSTAKKRAPAKKRATTAKRSTVKAKTATTGRRKQKTVSRATERLTDYESDQYPREQSHRSGEDNHRRRSESDRKRFRTGPHPEQKSKGRTGEHNFGRGSERELLTDNRSARKRRNKADRQQFYESRKEEMWPSRGSGEYRRSTRYENENRSRGEDYPSRRYEKNMYGGRHDDDTFAIRKGNEMYLPGYEDVDRNIRETRQHIDLHRGQDDFPSSLTNPYLRGGLPDEGYYESRERELYSRGGNMRSRSRSYHDNYPGRNRNHSDDERSRSERISSQMRQEQDHKQLRRTGNRKGRRSRSIASRHNQLSRGWDL